VAVRSQSVGRARPRKEKKISWNKSTAFSHIVDGKHDKQPGAAFDMAIIFINAAL
jgi:hypothetical protein